jgi:signal peptidase I
VPALRSFLRSNRAFLAFLLAFGLIRTAVADYNPVPSSSMHPNILEGDVVMVNRLAYNLKIPLTDILVARLGDPQRGDIVTFWSPRDGKRLIKRIVGLPGDVVAMKDKQLLINGQPVAYSVLAVGSDEVADGSRLAALQVREELGARPYSIQWLAGAANAATFDPITIPQDQYLMLGDNRDNSADSRYIGLVPRKLLIGRASRILVSAAIKGDWLPRIDRFGKKL